MILVAGGPVHGHIFDFYEKIRGVQRDIGVPVEWVLQVGNFGVWPDPVKMSRAYRNKGSQDDFSKIYHDKLALEYKTVFVAGKHEDHEWIKLKVSRGELQLIQNLTYLLNGYSTLIGNLTEQLSVTGLGKVYSPNSYTASKKPAHHYSKVEVEKACAHGPTDILLTHEPPHGFTNANRVSDSRGIQNIIYATRPKLVIHQSYSRTVEYRTLNTNCIALGANEIAAYEVINGRFDRIL